MPARETALPEAPCRIAVDVGGTFTDLVLVDAVGGFHVFKVSSVPADPSEGVLAAVQHAADSFGATPRQLLATCELFLHGSTVATNTVLEGNGARVGMLVTHGFRDFLEARRGFRKNPFDHRTPYPPVLVPRYLRLPVAGRIDARGDVVQALHEDDVLAAAAVFRRERVDAVAVCLLNSFENGSHEARCGELLREHWGGMWISLSHQVVPVIGEYERGSTTVVNAFVGPKVVRYLNALDLRLRELGLARDLLVLQSNGRAVSVAQVAERPVNLVLSGPAAGVGALEYFARTTGTDDLVTMEIGGTSCDVMLMSGQRVAITDQLEVGDYDLVIPSVDLNTVGAGGGTIAGVDAAGLLFAGPRGAGAVPGPACYGRGGSEPTVTDAQLVLGRLAPGPYAGGAVTLDAALAERAMRERVARPLGLDLQQAAAGIIRLVEQNLLQAVERVSSERGYDPARFVLVACGGAGPMHGASVGRRLGARAVLVPRMAGAFCALGMLNANVGQDFARVLIAPLEPSRFDEFEAAFTALEDEARQWLAAGGFAAAAMATQREADVRYTGQQWDVRIAGHFDSVAALRAAFEAEYERLFGHVQPGGTVELTKLRVVGIGRLPALQAPVTAPAEAPPMPAGRREVYIDENAGVLATDVYRGADLRPGHRIPGPLLVEEATTTILAGPDDTLEVLAAGDYLLHLGPHR